jgi:hypothetical protein
MQISRSRLLREVLSVFGGIGLVLTVLAHLQDALTFVGYVRLFVAQWAEWTHDLWNWLFWWIGFQVPEIVARGLTFSLSAILMVVGTRMFASAEDLVDNYRVEVPRWLEPLVPYSIVIGSVGIVLGSFGIFANDLLGVPLPIFAYRALILLAGIFLFLHQILTGALVVTAQQNAIMWLFMVLVLLRPNGNLSSRDVAIGFCASAVGIIALYSQFETKALHWRLVRVFIVISLIIVGNEIAKYSGVVPEFPGID